MNVPWAAAGMCDSDYIYAFQRVIMPIAYEYQPDLVISKIFPPFLELFRNVNRIFE